MKVLKTEDLTLTETVDAQIVEQLSAFFDAAWYWRNIQSCARSISIR